ncbi:MAG: bifunctional hydroxymethylpyrimidine kinase/phosphomethylpyrimidine kinase [Paludibacteraceae bacterium]|nr:bifunctional hydroxymethylpyrimidine kinase/phosphomethylpyrimidine kinase [Paludibacteraceae bacterium]
MTRFKVLTIAGSDSGGGAGIQADIKAISALGCYAASAITAVTVQNTLGVQAVHPVPADIVSGQITAVLDDIGADAIKIGMLFNADIIHTVAQTLHSKLLNQTATLNSQLSTLNYTTPVVLDPVMVSTSGHKLMNEDAIETLTTKLIPLATLITPNLPEAEVLLGEKITDLTSAAQKLAEKYKVSVLLKAGHLIPYPPTPLHPYTQLQLTDILYDYKEKRTHTYPHSRVETKNTHGTGCTLSSAIASELAKGLPLSDAIGAAIQYLGDALLSAKNDVLGHGFGPVDHFFAQK